MKTKKLNKKRLILTLLILLFIIMFIFLGVFFSKFASVDRNDKTLVEFVVNKGESGYNVFDRLQNEGYIKSSFALKLYSKIKGGISLTEGVKFISKSMNVIEIYNALENGNGSKEEVRFTFKEGRNVRQLISDITSITSITEEEILDTLNDKEFLNELINEYWFLTDEILNSDIYYSLEGYLYPILI